MKQSPLQDADLFLNFNLTINLFFSADQSVIQRLPNATMQHLLLIAIAAMAGSLTKGQLTVPQKELGFVYGKGEPGAKVKLAAYIDLTCPKSKRALSTLVNVADKYEPSRVQLKVYLFSLPHHRHSHTISKAARVLSLYKSPLGATVYDWFNAVYSNINSLTTDATVKKTDIKVLNFLAELARNVSAIPEEDFKDGVRVCKGKANFAA